MNEPLELHAESAPAQPVVTGSERLQEIDTETMLAELKQVSQRKIRLNRWFRPAYPASGLYYLVYSIIITLLHHVPPPTVAAPMAFLFHLATFINMTAVYSEWFFYKRIERTKTRLTTIVDSLSQNPRTVGALAQLCLPSALISYKEIAIEPLMKLLPTVQSADAPYITDSQMEALLELLPVPLLEGNVGQGRALRVALLKALEQVGDSRAIEPVRRLTMGKRNRPYHQAARECLAVLEEQGVTRTYQRTLLLPSSPEIGKETLLRPTAPQTETPPALLLRATTREEGG